eukprot:Seg1622.3 transcript_id=Seg1622.3/GoldUCD/mRNA.D3Y31 product="Protein TFG" protein_id=Seg1622.3/GoldUCD/D3Y31
MSVMASNDALNFASPHIDLSGKLIIKAQLGDDIRRIPIHNEEITYDELLLMMQRLFRGKIRSQDDILIKYKDEDGDLITIFDSSDLLFAKSLSRYLKITLFVNEKPKPLEHDQVKEIKAELLTMRDKLNDMISRLDTFSEERSINKEFETRENVARVESQQMVQAVADKVTMAKKQQPPVDGKAHAAMFDPLQTIKNEADTTNTTADVKPDPFAEIAQQQQSQPSSLTSNQQPYQPSATAAVSSQPNYPPQQPTNYPTQDQQYNNTYPTAQQPSLPQGNQSQYQTQQPTSQAGYYSVDQSSGQSGYGADKQPQGNAPPGQTMPNTQYDTSYTSQSYNPASQPTANYAAQSQYPAQAPQAPQDPLAMNQAVSSQGYMPGQQQQPPQNPYARSMSPRQQYPQPAKGYNIYNQSQGQQPPNMGFQQYPQY